MSPSGIRTRTSGILVNVDVIPFATGITVPDVYAYWKFDETSGTTALDSGPNGFNGTIDGTVTLGATGQIKSCFSMTHAGLSASPILLNTNAIPNVTVNAARTIMAWISTIDRTVGSNIFTYGKGATVLGVWAMYLASGGSGILRLTADSAGDFYDSNSAVISANNTFFHVAWVYDGSVWQSGITLYVNGVNTAITLNGANTGALATVANNFCAIGGDGGNNAEWDGKLDDIRVYQRALSASEISNIYNAGLQGNP